MSPEHPDLLHAAHMVVRQALQQCARSPLVVGICGAQGSGKSTLAAHLASLCEADGITTAVLSIDDLYLTRAEREVLAQNVHPLLRTRGVPGTHDVALGLAVLDDLDHGRSAPLPRFDKARDDRAPRERWDLAVTGTELLIFEGWCVGARPEPEAALAEPVNALERDEDAEGIWRAFANSALAGDYQQLFARIDILMLLAAPSFAVVREWRTEQERDLRVREGPDAAGVMRDGEVARFIQHYERLTRHILAEMPGRANLVAMLTEDRSPYSIFRRKL